VAEDGALAGGEERGRLTGVLGESLVSENVDPSMDPMKETTFEASPYSTVAQSSVGELLVVDGTSLRGSDARDCPIRISRCGKFVPRAVARPAPGTFFPLAGKFVPRGFGGFASGTLFPV
jgi:hypothetical protein